VASIEKVTDFHCRIHGFFRSRARKRIIALGFVIRAVLDPLYAAWTPGLLPVPFVSH